MLLVLRMDTDTDAQCREVTAPSQVEHGLLRGAVHVRQADRSVSQRFKGVEVIAAGDKVVNDDVTRKFAPKALGMADLLDQVNLNLDLLRCRLAHDTFQQFDCLKIALGVPSGRAPRVESGWRISYAQVSVAWANGTGQVRVKDDIRNDFGRRKESSRVLRDDQFWNRAVEERRCGQAHVIRNVVGRGVEMANHGPAVVP